MDFLIDPYRYRATLILTSRPYPQEVIESFNMGQAIIAGIEHLTQPVEAVNMQITLQSVIMPVVVGYVDYAFNDSINMSAVVSFVELTTTTSYKFGYATEAFDMTATVQDAVMTRVTGYIGNSIPPEGLDMTAAINTVFMG